MNTDDQIRQLFDSASQRVSLNTHYRLEQAAQAAVRARDLPVTRGPRPWFKFGLGFGGGAIAAAVVGVALFLPTQPTLDTQTAHQAATTATAPSAAPSPSVQRAPTAALPDDSTAWDEDPAFYAWLNSPEAKAVAFN